MNPGCLIVVRIAFHFILLATKLEACELQENSWELLNFFIGQIGFPLQIDGVLKVMLSFCSACVFETWDLFSGL